MSNKLLDELKWREIFNNVTSEERLDQIVKNKDGVYIGFDPSAISLHLGNYVMIRVLKIMKQHGLKTYALVGGATGMIGDPSGKSSERNLLDADTILKNKKNIALQLKKYADVDEIIDNYDFYSKMNFLDFLRDVGKHINVNYILEKETVKTRLETGISFTEFSYTLIQGYDFVKLYNDKQIYLQVGGSDQWGNITTGCELIRKFNGDNNKSCGLTINLLLKSDGKKFGKSEKGAIFLDKNLTPPYAMYHFLINQHDNDLEKLFKFLTNYSENEIKKIINEHQKDPKKRYGQQMLAKEIIKDIHSLEEYKNAENISKSLFNEDYSKLSENDLLDAFKGIESYTLKENNVAIIDILTNSGFMKSRREVRDLINQNGLSINGNKINDENYQINKENALHKKYFIIKKGKKTFYLIKVHNDK